MKLTLIAGARPNFMKTAPLIDSIKEAIISGKKIEYRLVHTGQHYDQNMSQSFFEELGIPTPDINLESGSGSQAEQTANIMVKFEKELLQNPADLVLVVGDVTSTLACSVVAKKLCTPVAHVEAGIRSGDMTMPEEINRIVTDSISDLFFTTSKSASENLLLHGISEAKVHFVGNTMVDTLLKNIPRFVRPAFYDNWGLNKGGYFVVTLHRPANVDNQQQLRTMVEAILRSADGYPVIFPVHPRTAKSLESLNLNKNNFYLTPPLSYLQFNYLVKYAIGVITDSGGITEETTVMNIPCITLRNSTERPETVTIGTNELIGTNPSALAPYMEKILSGNWKKGAIPELWDGKSATRIINTIISLHEFSLQNAKN
ncbi:MAG: non-hydrolyzing UDP-N-acetylglucosamine 2-epimerase [Sphingobacteriales bacterium]